MPRATLNVRGVYVQLSLLNEVVTQELVELVELGLFGIKWLCNDRGLGARLLARGAASVRFVTAFSFGLDPCSLRRGLKQRCNAAAVKLFDAAVKLFDFICVIALGSNRFLGCALANFLAGHLLFFDGLFRG